MTFDSTIHFYNLQEGLSQPQMLIVSDLEGTLGISWVSTYEFHNWHYFILYYNLLKGCHDNWGTYLFWNNCFGDWRECSQEKNACFAYGILGWIPQDPMICWSTSRAPELLVSTMWYGPKAENYFPGKYMILFFLYLCVWCQCICVCVYNYKSIDMCVIEKMYIECVWGTPFGETQNLLPA